MSKKKSISNIKRIGIATSEIRNATTQGKFFKQKLTNFSMFISQLRIVPVEHYPFLIEKYEKTIGKEIIGKRPFTEFLRHNLEFIDFTTEYSWAKNIIAKYSDDINLYLEISSKYSEYLLKGDYHNALEQLDEIEKIFGNSIWLFKNKIAFYQVSNGLEAQKKYTNSLKKKIPAGSLARYLIHWISVRNESQTSVSRFKTQIDQSISKLNPTTQHGYKEFLKYHLYDSDTHSIAEAFQVLRLSFSCSIIDYYEAFVSLLYCLVIDSDPKNNSRATYFLQTYSNQITDHRLQVMLVALGINEGSDQIDKFGIDLFDKLLTGAISEVKETNILDKVGKINLPANLLVVSFANSFYNEFLGDESRDENDAKTLYVSIVEGLSAILSRGIGDATKEYNELSKIALNFSDFNWSQCIKILSSKENSLFSNTSQNCFINVFKTGLIHPILFDCIDSNEIYSLFQKRCDDYRTDSPSTIYNTSLKSLKFTEKIDALYKPFRSLIKGICSYNTQNYSDSIVQGENLVTESNGYFRRRGYGLISYSHFEEKNYLQSCVKSVNCYLLEKNYYPFLPLTHLAAIIKPGTTEWTELNKMIELPILFDACIKHTNSIVENPRRFAYEDFLFSLGFEKPSELKNVLYTFEQSKIIYYLRYICLENVMDTSSAFEGGSNEVTNERLEICRMLVDYDLINEEIYKLEIKELVRRQVITSRRQEIDQSRIYVDVRNIKEWAEIEMEESFDRYITYLKSGLNQRPIKTETKNLETAMSIPEDEVNELLRLMVDEIRKKYLSADMGLDRFISTRIRHGELERTMRIPIQKHNLITKKEVKNGPYLSNTYWLDKINDFSENYSIMDRAFKRFSEDYDSLISKIANEWLQIYSIEKPSGLFDFRFNDLELQRIANSLDKNSTLEEFINLVIRFLDNALILLLVKIREVLNNRGKQEAKALLNKLHEEVQRVNLSTLELQRSISQARTDLTAQFDKIIEWFVPSSEGSSSPYTIEDAILVAEAIIKEATSNFKINISLKEEDVYSIHGQLPIFIDIFINIFENVVKRSGLDSPEADVIIHTEMLNEGYFMTFMTISNYLGSDIDINNLDATLARIRGLLNKGSYSEYLATERNSGLLKIHRSVTDFSVIDASIQPEMDFGIVANKFQISIGVPFKIFVLETETEENQ